MSIGTHDKSLIGFVQQFFIAPWGCFDYASRTMEPKTKKQMQEFREKIDSLDADILKLLTKRGAAAKAIGRIKEAEGLEVYVPSREKQIFKHIQAINKGPYGDASLFAIYREIISATRSLEQPTRVAFLGPQATFTHQAAKQHFGFSTHYEAASDISEVFTAVEKGHADYGVVPVENSTEGVVNYTLDKFADSELQICSEIITPIEHNLLSKELTLKAIKTVYSHPQALAQCRKWLALHLPHADCVETDSTAQAAEIVSQKKNCAAVASLIAADLYALNRLKTAIQDEAKNFTRFLVIGQEQAQKTGNDKTSIAFVAKNKVGVLYDLLKAFAANKVNLSKIESRPLKKRVWSYMFFVDMDGHLSESKIQKSMVQLAKHCESVKILGSYPKA